MRRKKVAKLNWDKMWSYGIIAVVLGIVVFLPLHFLQPPSATAAATGSNYAWSSNVGWISFDCANNNVCATSNYKVTEDASGNLSGYAWSSNIGWISFNASDVALCPGGGTCAPKVNLTSGAVSGWARACGSFDNKAACSGSQSAAGGWTGWIHLSGSGYGTTQAAGACAWTGWAWGGGEDAGGTNANIGWVHLNGASYQVSVADGGSGCSNSNPPPPGSYIATLTAAPASGWTDATNPSNVRNPGGTNDVAITLSTQNIASCDSAIAGGDSTIVVSNNDISNTATTKITSYSGTATNSGSSLKPYAFTLSCTDTSGVQHQLSAQVSVSGIPTTSCQIQGFGANPDHVSTNGVSTLSWSTNANCNACTISGTDGSSYASLDTTGSQATNPLSVTTNFTLTCTGNATSDSRTVPVTVMGIIEF